MLFKQRVKLYLLLAGILIAVTILADSLRVTTNGRETYTHTRSAGDITETVRENGIGSATASLATQSSPFVVAKNTENISISTARIEVENINVPNTEGGKLEQNNLRTQSLSFAHTPVTMYKEQDRFPMRGTLTLPVPHATLSIEELLQTQWIEELKELLGRINKTNDVPISIVSSDFRYRDILLNWLISAQVAVQPPLTHILVLSLDRTLHQLLVNREVESVYVPASQFLKQRVIKTLTRHIAFSQVQILRLTVMRLLNHWGYDVVNYDTDAIILKNPELLLTQHSSSDLVGSYGHHPSEVRSKWGVTVCCGMFLIRSTPKTETLWTVMSQILPDSYNDQSRLNNALLMLDPDWGDSNSHNILDTAWRGSTNEGFNITILPGKYVCRQDCSRKRRATYYVWHKGGSGNEGKKSYANQGKLWFLRQNWEAISNSNPMTTGVKWLHTIATNLEH